MTDYGSDTLVDSIGGYDGTIINYNADNWIKRAVRVDIGTGAPDHYHNGLPATSDGKLACDDASAITHYHQGLGFTAENRLAVILDAVVDHYGSGAAPFDANNRLVMTEAIATDYVSGVGYVDGRVSVNVVT